MDGGVGILWVEAWVFRRGQFRDHLNTNIAEDEEKVNKNNKEKLEKEPVEREDKDNEGTFL